jgi:hypothetical protein
MKYFRYYKTENEYKNDSIPHTTVSYTVDNKKNWFYENKPIIMTSESNPIAMEICYNQGWAANPDFMLKSEAEAVTDIGTAFAYGNSSYGYGGQTVGSLTTFHELKYFTSLTTLENGAFYGNTALKEISIPENIKLIKSDALGDCTDYSNEVKINKIYFYPVEAPYLSFEYMYVTTYVISMLNKNNGTLYYPKNGLNYDRS